MAKAATKTTKKTAEKPANTGTGRVAQVIGAVVDVQVGDWVCCCGGGGGVRKCSLYLMVVCYAV